MRVALPTAGFLMRTSLESDALEGHRAVGGDGDVVLVWKENVPQTDRQWQWQSSTDGLHILSYVHKGG